MKIGTGSLLGFDIVVAMIGLGWNSILLSNLNVFNLIELIGRSFLKRVVVLV